MEYKINQDNIELIDYDFGKGKIIITNPNYNYEYIWGAMGSNISEFIKKINNDYFSRCLTNDIYEIDIDKTITNIKYQIIYELDLPWYKHLEFQKQMRKVINEFKIDLLNYQSKHYFVDYFNTLFINKLDFNLIENRYESDTLEENFKSFANEPWHYIVDKHTNIYKNLCLLHNKLKKKL